MDACSCFCLFFCIMIGLTMLFLILSMDTLEPLEWGITYNKITKKIGDEIFENGRYFIGPWKEFIVYPANLVTVEFSDSRKATVLFIIIYIISRTPYKLVPVKDYH
jgi:hypothetical protein